MTSSYEAFQPEAYSPVQYAAPQGPKQAFDKAALIAREYQLGEQRNTSFYNQPALNNQVNEQNRKIDSNALEQRIAYKQSEFEKLTAFSDKLMKKVDGILEGFQKDNQKRGVALAVNGGLTKEQQEHYNEQRQLLAAESTEAEYASIKVLEQSQDRQVAENIRSMGSSERIGYTQQLTTQRKADYKNDLRTQMATNTSIKLIDNGGNRFVPADAVTDEQRQIAALAVTSELVQGYGLAGANPAMLEDSFYGGKDGIRATMTQYVVSANKAAAISDSQKLKQMKLVEVVNDNNAGKPADLRGLWLRHRNQLTKKGELPDNNSAWKGWKEDVEGLLKSGQMTPEQLEKQMRANLDPDQINHKGKTMAEARPALLASLKATGLKSQNTNWKDENDAADIAWKEKEKEVNTMMMTRIENGESFTEEDYNNAQNYLAKLPNGKISTLLDKNYSMFSQQTKNEESNEKLILQGIADGSITTEKLKDIGGDLYKKYRKEVAQVEQINQATESFAKQETAVRGEIMAVAGLGSDEDITTTGELMLHDFMKEIKEETRQIVLTQEKYAKDPRGAANLAMAKVMAEKRKEGLDRTKPFGIYAPGIRGAFPGYLQQKLKKAQRASEVADQTIKDFDKDWTKFGSSQIDNGEGEPYISTAKLEQNGLNYNTNTWRPHPLVERMRQLDPNLGNGWEVTNRLRVARGLKELPAPPSINFGNQGATPEVTAALKALESARTPQQVVRAGSQMGQFRPEMVPYGLGQQVVSAASKTNNSVQPIEVAAVAGVESGTRDIGPGHASYNGNDNGIMQINQAAHPGYIYKPGDTQGNLDYGAQVLTNTKAEAVAKGVLPEYQQAYSYAAYNAGGGSIPVVNGVPQFQDYHKDYIRKVYRQLGRYGDRSVYSSPFTMREDFLARQATHPDTGAGYTTDGAIDGNNRPVILAEPALMALAVLIEESGGAVKWSDIQSAQRSPAKNAAVGGVPGSNHLTGNAVDIHGTSRVWMKQNGAQYGWIWNDYMGPDGWHFDFEQ